MVDVQAVIPKLPSAFLFYMRGPVLDTVVAAVGTYLVLFSIEDFLAVFFDN